MATDSALQLAESIVVEGFGAFETELAAFLAEAARLEANPILVEVTGDLAAPSPVRERALGRLVVEISRTAQRPPLPRWVTGRIRSDVAA